MVDQELLSQFLEEANELYESLNEGLMGLDGDPTNTEFLNDVFRGFHTIKGGAGFLELKSMVELCHRCEDLFDQIRSGERKFTSSDMDVCSDVLNTLATYFEILQNGSFDLPYPSDLIGVLDKVLHGSDTDASSNSGQVLALDLIGDEEDMDDFFDSIKQAPKVDLPPDDYIPEKVEMVADSDDISSTKKKKSSESSVVRVETSKIDDIVNLVGELVLNRNRLKKVATELQQPDLVKSVSDLDFITSELQSSVMKTRMQPVKRVFQRFPRMVRDIARNLGKEVAIEMIGEDTEIDKNLVDALADPMIHMIRNSVDHGIEMPSQRLKGGKDVRGLVTLKAEQLGDHIEITISDDGKGISADFMRKTCIEKKLINEAEAEQLSDNDALQMIFLPGFSTAEKLTDLSGRGVGMDVVKTTVERLNGYVSIDSTPGFGTSFTLKIPLTMAILQTLMVEVGEQSYAIPLPGISEIFVYEQDKVNVIDGQNLSRFREGSVPIFYLDEILPPDDLIEVKGISKKIVAVSIGDKVAGLVVDNVVGQEEVVIKPMGAFLGELNEYAGATITGDGQVALILDVNKLLSVS